MLDWINLVIEEDKRNKLALKLINSFVSARCELRNDFNLKVVQKFVKKCFKRELKLYDTKNVIRSLVSMYIAQYSFDKDPEEMWTLCSMAVKNNLLYAIDMFVAIRPLMMFNKSGWVLYHRYQRYDEEHKLVYWEYDKYIMFKQHRFDLSSQIEWRKQFSYTYDSRFFEFIDFDFVSSDYLYISKVNPGDLYHVIEVPQKCKFMITKNIPHCPKSLKSKIVDIHGISFVWRRFDHVNKSKNLDFLNGYSNLHWSNLDEDDERYRVKNIYSFEKFEKYSLYDNVNCRQEKIDKCKMREVGANMSQMLLTTELNDDITIEIDKWIRGND